MKKTTASPEASSHASVFRSFGKRGQDSQNESETETLPDKTNPTAGSETTTGSEAAGTSTNSATTSTAAVTTPFKFTPTPKPANNQGDTDQVQTEDKDQEEGLDGGSLQSGGVTADVPDGGEDPKAEANRSEAKFFIKEGKRVLRRLRLRGAGRKHLDSLQDLLRLYEAELKNKQSDFDWSSDNAVNEFRKKIVTPGISQSVEEDLTFLKAQYPDEERILNYIANWVEEMLILPAKPIATLPTALPPAEIVHQPKPWETDPLYISRRLESRSGWWDLSLEYIITKKLGLTYKEVEKQFLKPHGRHTDFRGWIKKSIIQYDWTDLDDEIPDIFQINVEVFMEKDMGVMKKIPYIEAYSYEQAFAEAGRQGLVRNADEPFYWVHKISGKKEKFRYNFASSLAYKNYVFVRDVLKFKNGTFTQAWFNRTMFDELLAAAGGTGQVLYNSVMKKAALSDKMLSNDAVVLISKAQETFIKSDNSSGMTFRVQKTPTGLLSLDFLGWLLNYRERKAKQEAHDKKLTEMKQEHEEKMLSEFGEKIKGNYYRYVRDGRELEVNRNDLFLLQAYIDQEAYSSIVALCSKGNPQLKEWQDLFYMLTWTERKVVLKAFSTRWYLWEEEEEALNMVLKNTPDNQQSQLKSALEKNNKELYNDLKSLCDNDNTRREFYFITEKIVGVDWGTVNDLKEEKNQGITRWKILKMSKRQINALTDEEYKNKLVPLLNNSYDHNEGLVDLIIYASPSQQKIVREQLLADNMYYFIRLKRALSESLYARLSFGETITDQVTNVSEKRGSGLNDLLMSDKDYLNTVKGWLKDYKTWQNLSNNEIKLSTVPRSVILALTEDEKVNMVIFLAKGGREDNMDEMTIIRVMEVVRNTNNDKGRQSFYNKLQAKDPGLTEIRHGVDNTNYSRMEVLISELNPDGSKQRKENVENSGYFSEDAAIGTLSEKDMSTYTIAERKLRLSNLIGDSWFEQDFTYVGFRDEKSVIRLINSTPTNQIEDLQRWLVGDNGERYKALDNAIHGEEYKEFHDKLQAITERRLKSNAMANPEGLRQYYKGYREKELLGASHEKGMPFANPGILSYLVGSESYTYYVDFIDNKIKVTIYNDDTGRMVGEPKKLDPWELVVVEHKIADTELGVKKGDKVVVPAIGLFFLQNKQDVQGMFEALDVALLFVGIGEIKAAVTITARLLAATNIIISGGNLVMRSFGQHLPKGARELWQDLNTIFIAYSVLALGSAAIRTGRNLIKQLRGKLSSLSPEQRQLLEADLLNKEQILKDAERIQAMSLEELQLLREGLVKGDASSTLLSNLDELIKAKQFGKATDEIAERLFREQHAAKLKAEKELAKKRAAEETVDMEYDPNTDSWKAPENSNVQEVHPEVPTGETLPVRNPTKGISTGIPAVVESTEEIVRGVSKSDFIKSVRDFNNGAKAELAELSWDLWKQQKWSELEELFNKNELNRLWPPNSGAINLHKIEHADELAGKTFDRFQDTENLGGSFASPVTTGEVNTVFTYDSRALSAKIPEGTYYIKFELSSNLPANLMFEYGDAIPWFTTLGGAVQIKSSIKFSELVLGKDYIIVEKLQYVNGRWIDLMQPAEQLEHTVKATIDIPYNQPVNNPVPKIESSVPEVNSNPDINSNPEINNSSPEKPLNENDVLPENTDNNTSLIPKTIESKDPLPADFIIPEEGIIHFIGGRKFRLRNGGYEEWDQLENKWKKIDKKVYEDRAKGIVKGLYESIDVDYKPVEVDFKDEFSTKSDGEIEITTKVFPKNNKNLDHGEFVRTYNPTENMLVLNAAFINDAPAWIKEVKIPFIDGKGIPMQAYVTLRQMKMMNITPGSLIKAKLSTVQNGETLLYVTKAVNDAKSEPNDFSAVESEGLLSLESMRYARTSLTLAGYEITNATVVKMRFTKPIKILEAINQNGIKELTGELIEKYGFNYDSEIYINFDVYLDLKLIK